jgi:hypothetical protein
MSFGFRRFFLKNLAFGIVMSMILSISPVANAQELTISAYFMSEQDACGRQGYGGVRSCRRLSVPDITNRNSYVLASKVPPGKEIKLGRLSRVLKRYYERTCNFAVPCTAKLSDKKSLVLLFEWATPQNGEVKFERFSSENVREYGSSHKLRNRSRWINHQRAEVFVPKKKFNWRLSLNGSSWNFVTK